jgi:rhamnulokinase
MGERAYLAVDLGAESGRVVAGVLRERASGRRLELHEVHRFVHAPVRLPSGLHWDVAFLWREVVAGLRAAGEWARAQRLEVASIGVDTWGVDYVLLSRSGELIGLPRAYRDSRHDRGMAILRERIGMERLYAITGMQEMAINTASQLAVALSVEPELLRAAGGLLMMPDLFHYLLTGRATNEATIASSSQLLDARSGQWSTEVIGALGLPAHIFQPVVPSGTRLGELREEVAAETGLPESATVVAPGAHDTASAVAAVPLKDDSSCFISSGTWSVMGVEIPSPILTEEARRAGFTNERGAPGTIRFSRNLSGLWLVQEIRRDLERLGRSMDYVALTEAAAAARPFRTRIDVSHAPLAAPGAIIEKLRTFARACGDPEPQSPGELVRCCLEGLAMAYRTCIGQVERLLGRAISTVHIVGGGSRNVLLCQMAADATGRRVVVGPVEATAAGNILVQASAVEGGAPGGTSAARRIVSESFDLVEYLPRETAAWDAAAAHHEEICGR